MTLMSAHIGRTDEQGCPPAALAWVGVGAIKRVWVLRARTARSRMRRIFPRADIQSNARHSIGAAWRLDTDLHK